MASDNSQVPWTDEQWARVRQVIHEEANHARIAATFLPLYGPLPPDTDFVPKDLISYVTPPGAQHERMSIDDVTTIRLATLQVKVFLRGAQMADPDMTSALALFRRAANVLARLEDAVVFNGQAGTNEGPSQGGKGLRPIWEILGGQQCRGLLIQDAEAKEHLDPKKDEDPEHRTVRIPGGTAGAIGEAAVGKVSDAIGLLEADGHYGPFALVLDQKLFEAVQTPNKDSLVLPQDRLIPFLGGGSLLRSSALPEHSGVVVALGGAPVELVVATDVSLAFLQVTTEPWFVFRVYEKTVLRIKETGAIVALRSPRK
jgi:uncharacterized linocin/CFP29 family protein